jgi:hypothetical protein
MKDVAAGLKNGKAFLPRKASTLKDVAALLDQPGLTGHDVTCLASTGVRDLMRLSIPARHASSLSNLSP